MHLQMIPLQCLPQLTKQQVVGDELPVVVRIVNKKITLHSPSGKHGLFGLAEKLFSTSPLFEYTNAGDILDVDGLVLQHALKAFAES